MYNFIYEKVNTIKEVEKLLSENEETKILAGGQTLIPTMKQRLASPSTLIDIFFNASVELSSLTYSTDRLLMLIIDIVSHPYWSYTISIKFFFKPIT